MFVKNNSLSEIKAYFKSKLPNFSNSELNSMLKQLAVFRLNIGSAEFMLSDNVLLSESDLLFFRSVVKRLLNNEPFQYIIGEVEFYGVELISDHRALVPRPETEELVDWILNSLNKEHTFILDLCSGSGCIAFAIKNANSSLKVRAIEYSKEALKLIQENKEKTKLDIELIEGDVLSDYCYESMKPGSYDCWVSNPPYIPNKDKVRMHKNVLGFEPHMALFVEDNDPLLFYREIADKAKIYLRPGGFLFFEIHEDFGDQMIQLLKSLGFVNIELRKDMQGRHRMLRAQSLFLLNES
ncbi:MAG: peptide chain release factor N(5)-glutamine methyltransferase [Crocinitomicaceae bacterium]|nr:peptide chain release factor N(5)-glutamine methyltransferase [Crocinitomicaceae bacterium]